MFGSWSVSAKCLAMVKYEDMKISVLLERPMSNSGDNIRSNC